MQNSQDQKYKDLITECDSLIKAGKIAVVSNRLAHLTLTKVPRKHCASLAKICRRAGLINLGLRLLQPIIRNEKANKSSATDLEICEYAVLLSRNGSVDEALNLLKSIQNSETPEVLTSLAYCSMARWEYPEAIAPLERFLSSSADEYSKLIARVNLASAYLATSQWLKARELCTETIEVAEKMKATRLVGNCYEIRGQVHFRTDDFISARADLQKAQEIFDRIHSYDLLFVSKWQAVMQAFESRTLEPLMQFRQKAVSQKHWESVRDADLFSLKVKFDQSRLDYLIYGTPLPAYRERILQMIGVPASSHFIRGPRNAPLLDLKSGQVGSECILNPGKKIHQMLALLLQDFYVPRNMGSLFAQLYPDEYFDINSSPLRVYQLLARTRKWISDSHLPLEIQETEGTYRLEIVGSLGIQLELGKENSFSLSDNRQWLELKNQIPAQQPFTAKEACEKLKWSRAKFLRAIESAVASGELQRMGQGPSTLYEIVLRKDPGFSHSAA